MKRFTIADLHFGHNKVLEYEPSRLKLGSNPNEMNRELIKKWNSVVGVDDHCYIIGDVSFLDQYQTRDILSLLNGYKHLIIGNHDFSFTHSKLLSLGFSSVQNELKLKLAKDVMVKMNHFPYESAKVDSDEEKGRYPEYRPIKEDNVWLIHGHSHSKGKKMDLDNKSICVSCELHNFTPVNLDTIVGQIRKEQGSHSVGGDAC